MSQISAAFSDWSGGITDYMLNAKPNQSKELANYLIDPNKKPFLRAGSQIFSSTEYQIPDGNQRVQTITSYLNNLLEFSGRKVWFNSGVSQTELIGPGANPAWDVTASVNDILSNSTWNNILYLTNSSYQKPIKIFQDETSTFRLRTAGLPKPSGGSVAVGLAGTRRYLYAFTFSVQYKVGNATFEDESSPQYFTLELSGDPAVNPNVVTLPILTNTASTNYDLTNMKVNVYRTVDGGITYYRLNNGQQANGTVSINDNTPDPPAAPNLQDNFSPYFNSAVSNTEPPACKVVHVADGFAYWGDVKEGSDILPFRVYQSKASDPDSVNSFVDLEDDVVGINSHNGQVVVFCKNRIYRLLGKFSDNGQGGIDFQEISPNAGCASPNCIVKIRNGLVWAGNDGFYFSDGFNVQKISMSINETYKNAVLSSARALKIVGQYDVTEDRIYWACSLNLGSTENDSFLILDNSFGLTDNSCFTKARNGEYFKPTSICFLDKNLIRADSRGYIFKHLPTLYTDPRIDITKIPEDWGTAHIPYVWESVTMDFEMPHIRKYGIQCLVRFSNTTNISVQVISINDGDSIGKNLTVIRYRNNLVWGDPEPIWGTDVYLWNYTGYIEQKRKFPAGSLRFSDKQIRIQNAYTIVFNSDTYGDATVDPIGKTLTLNGSLDFPLDLLDYSIAVSTDQYSKKYPIVSFSGNEVTVFDSENALQYDNTAKWQIYGYPKGEDCSLRDVVVYVEPMTDSQPTYYGTAAETGKNES